MRIVVAIREGERPMRVPFLVPGFCTLLVTPAPAGEPNKPDGPPAKPKLIDGTPAEQVRALARQFDDAIAAVRPRLEAAATEADQLKLLPLVPNPTAYAALFVQVAEKHPDDP